MKALVTGHRGFIGSALFARLERDGHEAVGLDLPDDLVDDDAGDLLSRMSGCDTVFHLAAHSVGMCAENPFLGWRVNTEGTLNVLAAAKVSGVQSVVFSSSASVYGTDMPGAEWNLPRPVNVYGASKVAAEALCEQAPLPVASLRYMNVYPGHSDVIAKWLEADPIKVASPESAFDFVHIDDVVEANLAAVGRSGVFNIGSGQVTTLGELAAMIAEMREVRVETGVGEPMLRFGPIDNAKMFLEYRPMISIGQYLGQCVG